MFIFLTSLLCQVRGCPTISSNSHFRDLLNFVRNITHLAPSGKNIFYCVPVLPIPPWGWALGSRPTPSLHWHTAPKRKNNFLSIVVSPGVWLWAWSFVPRSSLGSIGPWHCQSLTPCFAFCYLKGASTML